MPRAPTLWLASRPASRDNGEWWLTGAGVESFCGIPMAITQYAFNGRDELFAVTFIPEVHDRDRLGPSALHELGAPADMGLRWTIGDVEVDVKMAGVMVTMTNKRYT